MWYKARDIAKALGYKNPKQVIIDHVDDDYMTKYQNLIDNTQKSFKNSQPHTKFINKNGVKQLVLKSRMPKAVDIAKIFDIDISEKVLYKE